MMTNTLFHWLAAYPKVRRQYSRIVRRLPHRRRIIVRYGQNLEIDPSELAGYWLYYERDYDNYVFDFLSNRVSQFPRALDIGAHIGIYTVYLAARIARVDAFEPDPDNAKRLQENIERNHLKNVTIHRSCVGLTTGTVRFQPANAVNQGLGRITVESNGSVTRPSVSLDDFLGSPLSEPCLIKMDIEGGEWLALPGGREALSAAMGPVALLLEVHPDEIKGLGGTAQQLKDLLEQYGFVVRSLTPAGLQPVPTGIEGPERFWWAEKPGQARPSNS